MSLFLGSYSIILGYLVTISLGGGLLLNAFTASLGRLGCNGSFGFGLMVEHLIDKALMFHRIDALDAHRLSQLTQLLVTHSLKLIDIVHNIIKYNRKGVSGH